MTCIQTSVCGVVSIDVKPVRYRTNHPKDAPAYVFAVQQIVVTAFDGSKFHLTVHIEEGCPALGVGTPIVFPTVEQVDGAEQ